MIAFLTVAISSMSWASIYLSFANGHIFRWRESDLIFTSFHSMNPFSFCQISSVMNGVNGAIIFRYVLSTSKSVEYAENLSVVISLPRNLLLLLLRYQLVSFSTKSIQLLIAASISQRESDSSTFLRVWFNSANIHLSSSFAIW